MDGMNTETLPGNSPHDHSWAARVDRHAGPEVREGWYDKVEAFISRLSVRDTFWHRICSLIWLPLAAFSGIRMKQIDADTFTAILPFTRFNRNWYRAMAGGALLANSEIAGGMYVFGVCGADYTVVCKELSYKFMRPCLGPAIYRITPQENLRELIAAKSEFNITLDLDIFQQLKRGPETERRVGRCVATFHVTPKSHHKRKKSRRR
jgi:hypothetical protein